MIRDSSLLGAGPATILSYITPNNPQSEIAATKFLSSAEVWGKNWTKQWVKNWVICEIFWHFRASFVVQNDPPKFLPKFLQIYHFVSCGRKVNKNTSPRSFGAWGAQHINATSHSLLSEDRIARQLLDSTASVHSQLLWHRTVISVATHMSAPLVFRSRKGSHPQDSGLSKKANPF